tara:strand:+ start:176 stop:508 length:333 start_codon:yes stop_codon:yes gene_type:complete
MNKKGEDQNRNKSKNKNKNIKDDGTIEFYKNGMNRLHSGNKILVAEDDLITENKVGYKSEKKMFRVVRCCDVTEKPLKFYFNSPEDYEKTTGNIVSAEIKKEWLRYNMIE